MHLLRFSASAFPLILGAALLSPAAWSQVAINEVMADNRSYALADGSISDWVELRNTGAQPVSLGNWSLTDSAANPARWRFPNSVTLPAGGYLVVALDSERAPSSAAGFSMNAGFSIKSTGDNLYLYNAAGTLADSLRFGPQATDFSLGALPDGSDQFVLCTPTPGEGNTAQPLGSQSALRINEWMASPATGEDWFEVYNPGTLPVQLTGLYFVDNNLEPSHVFPLSFIGVGRDGFTRFYADNSTNFNEVDFGLGGGGDSIGLYTAGGNRIDSVSFGQQAADRSEGRLPDGSSTVQRLNLATPAGSNLVLYEGLVVNEVLAHTDLPYEDAVEFLNVTASPIDIGGWHLSNQRSDLQKYRIPAGTVVPANGYVVFYESQFNGAGAAKPFNLNSAHGDRIVLSQTAASGALTGFIVEQEFGATERFGSLGRVPLAGSSTHVFAPLVKPTFGVENPKSVAQFRTGKGAANSGPKIGPVVISEIMYNPSTNTAAADLPSDPDEFVELANLSGAPVALYDEANPENVWKSDGGITYSFRRFSSIPANGTLLLVSFDPDVQTQLAAAFRAKYSVAPSVPLHGPFAGKLANSGEAVVLYRPDRPQDASHPDAGFVPYLQVDRVDYLDQAPWPAAADGTGVSLQKASPGSFGNDPANWSAAAPTAGQVPGAAVAPILSATFAGGRISLSFEAQGQKTYQLQARSTLAPGGAWQVLQTFTETTTKTVALTRDITGTTEFFRLVQIN